MPSGGLVMTPQLFKAFKGLRDLSVEDIRWVAKRNHKGNLQRRILITTKDCLYVATEDGKIKRHIPLELIEEIFCNANHSFMSFRVPEQYDLMLFEDRLTEDLVKARRRAVIEEQSNLRQKARGSAGGTGGNTQAKSSITEAQHTQELAKLVQEIQSGVRPKEARLIPLSGPDDDYLKPSKKFSLANFKNAVTGVKGGVVYEDKEEELPPEKTGPSEGELQRRSAKRRNTQYAKMLQRNNNGSFSSPTMIKFTSGQQTGQVVGRSGETPPSPYNNGTRSGGTTPNVSFAGPNASFTGPPPSGYRKPADGEMAGGDEDSDDDNGPAAGFDLATLGRQESSLEATAAQGGGTAKSKKKLYTLNAEQIFELVVKKQRSLIAGGLGPKRVTVQLLTMRDFEASGREPPDFKLQKPVNPPVNPAVWNTSSIMHYKRVWAKGATDISGGTGDIQRQERVLANAPVVKASKRLEPVEPATPDGFLNGGRLSAGGVLDEMEKKKKKKGVLEGVVLDQHDNYYNQPENLKILEAGGSLFSFTCVPGLKPFEKELLTTLMNISGFKDEVSENHVPHFDINNTKEVDSYTYIIQRCAYLLPEVDLDALTPELLSSVEYHKECQTSNTKIWTDVPKSEGTTFRITKPIIRFLYSMTLQFKVSQIPNRDLDKISKLVGVTLHKGMLLERTKRSKSSKADATAKAKSYLLYTSVRHGVLVTNITLGLNTFIPSVVASVVNSFGSSGLAETCETAAKTRKFLHDRFPSYCASPLVPPKPKSFAPPTETSDAGEGSGDGEVAKAERPHTDEVIDLDADGEENLAWPEIPTDLILPSQPSWSAIKRTRNPSTAGGVDGGWEDGGFNSPKVLFSPASADGHPMNSLASPTFGQFADSGDMHTVDLDVEDESHDDDQSSSHVSRTAAPVVVVHLDKNQSFMSPNGRQHRKKFPQQDDDSDEEEEEEEDEEDDRMSTPNSDIVQCNTEVVLHPATARQLGLVSPDRPVNPLDSHSPNVRQHTSPMENGTPPPEAVVYDTGPARPHYPKSAMLSRIDEEQDQRRARALKATQPKAVPITTSIGTMTEMAASPDIPRSEGGGIEGTPFRSPWGGDQVAEPRSLGPVVGTEEEGTRRSLPTGTTSSPFTPQFRWAGSKSPVTSKRVGDGGELAPPRMSRASPHGVRWNNKPKSGSSPDPDRVTVDPIALGFRSRTSTRELSPEIQSAFKRRTPNSNSNASPQQRPLPGDGFVSTIRWGKTGSGMHAAPGPDPVHPHRQQHQLEADQVPPHHGAGGDTHSRSLQQQRDIHYVSPAAPLDELKRLAGPQQHDLYAVERYELLMEQQRQKLQAEQVASRRHQDLGRWQDHIEEMRAERNTIQNEPSFEVTGRTFAPHSSVLEEGLGGDYKNRKSAGAVSRGPSRELTGSGYQEPSLPRERSESTGQSATSAAADQWTRLRMAASALQPPTQHEEEEVEEETWTTCGAAPSPGKTSHQKFEPPQSQAPAAAAAQYRTGSLSPDAVIKTRGGANQTSSPTAFMDSLKHLVGIRGSANKRHSAATPRKAATPVQTTRNRPPPIRVLEDSLTPPMTADSRTSVGRGSRSSSSAMMVGDMQIIPPSATETDNR